MNKGFGFLTAMSCGVAVLFLAPTASVNAHGDVAPQAVDTAGLPNLGDEQLEENPWRDPTGDAWSAAVAIGDSGYNQNCARCHGLGAVSGGLAPDLRYLEADIDGDEWYMERFNGGFTQNGITKMPAFGELLSQEAAWAIRTYLETRPDDGALDDHTDALQTIKTDLESKSASINAGDKTVADYADDIGAIKQQLTDIAQTVETGSGAPLADSVASRAVAVLDNSDGSLKKAVDILSVGLSVAQ
ncbi:cytochrome c-550 PedF [Amylibacter ulvae]|uniref:Cytochrome c-550 PedF n=1 Tax=Paramylibacter ulvae TaxID=1651968 RepID=A0ABQ3CYD1_9RHOB|nr:cytochrome c-550 PedF [Amylibacter ulvae]GHA42506.1 cytochrome c-550 PedF [Amylibacter ulvae]